jgi:hypothetical protein
MCPAESQLGPSLSDWMGTACILNARRGGRTHRRFTGPYRAMIIPALVLGWVSIRSAYTDGLRLPSMIVLWSKIIW